MIHCDFHCCVVAFFLSLDAVQTGHYDMTRTVIVIKICRWTGFVTRKQWLWRLLHGRGMSLMSHEKPKIINMFMSSVLSLEHVVFPGYFFNSNERTWTANRQKAVHGLCLSAIKAGPYSWISVFSLFPHQETEKERLGENAFEHENGSSFIFRVAVSNRNTRHMQHIPLQRMLEKHYCYRFLGEVCAVCKWKGRKLKRKFHHLQYQQLQSKRITTE